jgi:hypothetical protein
MRDIAYVCHHCGSTHEAESIRQNLYLDQRPIANYAPERGGVAGFGQYFLRRRVSQGLAWALWPKYPRNSRRG